MTERLIQENSGALAVVVPVTATFICCILNVLPYGSVMGFSLAPAFTLIAVFYWAVRAPKFLPAAMVFAAGLLLDILGGAALGVWTFVLMVTYALAVSQRYVLQAGSGSPAWLGFAIFAAVAHVLLWVGGSIALGAALPVLPFVVQLVTTLLVFPAMAWVFNRTYGLLFG